MTFYMRSNLVSKPYSIDHAILILIKDLSKAQLIVYDENKTIKQLKIKCGMLLGSIPGLLFYLLCVNNLCKANFFYLCKDIKNAFKVVNTELAVLMNGLKPISFKCTENYLFLFTPFTKRQLQ